MKSLTISGVMQPKRTSSYVVKALWADSKNSRQPEFTWGRGEEWHLWTTTGRNVTSTSHKWQHTGNEQVAAIEIRLQANNFSFPDIVERISHPLTLMLFITPHAHPSSELCPKKRRLVNQFTDSSPQVTSKLANLKCVWDSNLISL
jgi:hypothetical protein